MRALGHIPLYELQWLGTADLPRERVLQIGAHLADCERCLVRAIDVGADRARFLEENPPETFTQQVLARLSGRPALATVAFFAHNPDGTVSIVRDRSALASGGTIDVRIKTSALHSVSVWAVEGCARARRAAHREVRRPSTFRLVARVRWDTPTTVLVFVAPPGRDSTEVATRWLKMPFEPPESDALGINDEEDILVRSVTVRGV